MSEATEQQNLQGLSIRERHQVKEQFFRLYRKTGNVAESDETGVGTRTGFQRGYAPKGKIPLPAVTSVVSCRVSMISAVSNRGAPSFRAYTGPMRMRRFLHFAKAVLYIDHKRLALVFLYYNLTIID